MKKPNIIYCNVIREDKEADRIAIKARHIEEMIDALIEAYSLMKRGHGKKVTLKEKEGIEKKIEQALKKAGVE